MMGRTISLETLRAFNKYDSPTISNVIELFGVRPRNGGYMNSSIKALFPEMPPIVGYASTATYRSARPVAKGESQAGFMAHLEVLPQLPAPRIVVFEDLDDPPAASTFGEVMCAVYKRFDCRGVITSGAGRDLEALRNLGLPAFASSVCVSHGYGRIEDTHQPVHVGGLTISPGDLIHADGNGVVVIPSEIAEEVARACPLWLDAERDVLDYLKEEDVTIQGVAHAFDRLKAKIGAILRERASKSEESL
jgi:regulator of RNase E activity RraA